MSVKLDEFRLGLTAEHITSSSRSYRPPSWPPPRDWVVVEDSAGNEVSRWGDPSWNLTAWAGYALSLNFEKAGGRSIPLDSVNADLLRMLTTWRLWGPRPATEAISLKTAFFSPLRCILTECAKHDIAGNDLYRHPEILEKVAKIIRPSAYRNTIRTLQQIWDAREFLGFCLVDQIGIARLSELDPDHSKRQTPYIPPRIWAYQVQRLRECLDDFVEHREGIESCFHFCVDAYAHNYGSLSSAMQDELKRSLVPFISHDKIHRGKFSGKHYHGRFEGVAERFGIKELLAKWVDFPDIGLTISQFSKYLSLADFSAQAYIANFTLQRIEEVSSLRFDCLVWEIDDHLGSVPIIRGETTKTVQDSDARWPTSPSVLRAVEVAQAVAKMRMRCASSNPRLAVTPQDVANPHLFHRAFEPWAPTARSDQPYSVKATYASYGNLLQTFPKLFDSGQLTITETDLKIAKMVTPTLSQLGRFEVGRTWPLAWHQLRRTGAVNMFASGELSDVSVQFLMKHSSRLMPIYYGRGHTKLKLNKEVNDIVNMAMYEAMSRRLLGAMAERFVSPLGAERKKVIVVNLVGEKDAKQLVAAARRGNISCRETRIGLCTKRGPCEYGGIESVSRCTGGKDDKPCADALFDKSKRSLIDEDRKQLELQLEQEPRGTPRHRSMHAEISGLNRYISHVDAGH